jgi:hypothetical protein
MDPFRALFEEVIQKQVELVGRDKAFAQAEMAGLSISPLGKIVSAAEDPLIILLRLVKAFTASGKLVSLEACTPLIYEFLRHTNRKTLAGQR